MRSVRSIAFASLTFLTAWDARAASGDDAELARSARVETILRVALERNPDLAENQARARAALARSDAAVAVAGPRSQVRAVGRPADEAVRARRGADVDARPPADVPRLGIAGRARPRRRRGSRHRAGCSARAPPGPRRPGEADLRRLLPQRPGAAAPPRARRAERAHPGARAPQSAHRARQPAGRPPAGAGADADPHRRRADRTRAAIQPGAAQRAHEPRPRTRRWARPRICRSRPGRTSRRWNGASTRTDPRWRPARATFAGTKRWWTARADRGAFRS